MHDNCYDPKDETNGHKISHTSTCCKWKYQNEMKNMFLLKYLCKKETKKYVTVFQFIQRAFFLLFFFFFFPFLSP